jgi:GT2 family glycosyltransferase
VSVCPTVSTIIQNWSRRDLLQPCLTALRCQSCPSSEIILVDNGSTDDSVAHVREHFPEVTVIALPENRGFAAGNNLAMQASSGEYVALLNNDAQPEPNWLEALTHSLATRPEVGFCASKMLYLDAPGIIDTAGDVFYDYGVGGKRGADQPDGDGFSRTEYVFGACAGAAIYRRIMLEDIGLFDEDFYMYMEDIDLSFRAQLRGYRCLFVPAARVYHQVAATAGRGSHLSIYHSLRNMLYVLVKDLPTSLLLRHLGAILFHFLAGDAVFALSGYAGDVARARRDNLRMLGKMLAKRTRIQGSRRVPNAYIESILTKGQLGARVRSTLSRFLHGRHLVRR